MPQRPTVFVYSRGGHSARLAADIAHMLDAHLCEITTPRYRIAILGWLAAGRDGLRGEAAPLSERIDLPPAGSLVLLVGPVWAGKPAAPLNTMIDRLRDTDHPVAFAMTCGDPKGETAPLDVAAARLGREPVATLMVSNKAQAAGDEKLSVNTFVQGLSNAIAA